MRPQSSIPERTRPQSAPRGRDLLSERVLGGQRVALDDAAFVAVVVALHEAQVPFIALDDPNGDAVVHVPQSADVPLDKFGAVTRASTAPCIMPFDVVRQSLDKDSVFAGVFGRDALQRWDAHAIARGISAVGAKQWHEAELADVSAVPFRAWRTLSSESRASFCDRVAEAVQACRQTDLKKLVLAREWVLRAPNGCRVDIARTLHRLRRRDVDAVVYAVSAGPGHLHLGATPEVLARVRDGVLTTHALAGTRRVTDGAMSRAVDELLNSEKDAVEHKLVVEMIVERLRPYSTAVTAAARPCARRVPGMCHLETPIVATLREGAGIEEVTLALHPTPALAGSPPGDAARWLRAREPLRRGLYGGIVGWSDTAGDGVSAVAIRGFEVMGDVVRLRAGAGIVPLSDPASEWNETRWKLESAFGAIALAGAAHD